MNELPSDTPRNELPTIDLTPAGPDSHWSRRSRRGRVVGGVVAAALTVAGLAALLGGHLRPADSAGGTDDTVRLAAAAGPTASAGASPDTGLVPVTGRALLGQLLDALPPSVPTSGHAAETAYVDEDSRETVAQVYLTTPRGTGMVRAFVGYASPDKVCTAQTSCRVDDRGNKYTVSHMADNCVQDTVIWMVHPDGTGIQLNLATCLAWDGTGNKKGVLPMTEEEAVRLAGDPGIRRMITPAARDAAQTRFPQVPRLTS
ncbi:hypothetical protein ACIA8O_20460 [Kitasatospora sp. NPDC051853]|uniref:hypothetical protein n=1 Tax=Kitasatospora sp. NPDC051853 TaxID=3364058 RepID=UPI003789B6FD